MPVTGLILSLIPLVDISSLIAVYDIPESKEGSEQTS